MQIMLGAFATIRRILPLAIGAVAVASTGGVAFAQSGFVDAPPPEKYTVSPGGVDMRSGQYVYRSTDFSAGDADSAGAMTLERIENPGIPGHVAPFANLSHNWDITLTERQENPLRLASPSTPKDYRIYVSMGGRYETFRALGPTNAFQQTSKAATARLSHTGTRGAGGEVYTYSMFDGTTATFRSLGLAGASDCSATVRCAYVSEMTSPDGTKYSFQYDTRSTGNRARIRGVTSNHGYQLFFEYEGSDWNLITKACLYNTAVTAPPSDSHCNFSALSTVTYGYTTFASQPKLASVTDAAGKVWGFTYASTSGGHKISYTKPDQSTPWLVNWTTPDVNSFNVPVDVTWQQDFSDGSHWTYDFDHSPTENQFDLAPDTPLSLIAGGSYTDALGHKTIVKFDFPAEPFSLTARNPSPSVGEILSYQLFGGGQELVWQYDGDDASGNPQYSVDWASTGQKAAFQSILDNNALSSMVLCWDCSAAQSFYLQIAYQVTPGPAAITDPLNRTSTFDYCDKTLTFPTGETFTCSVGQLQSWTDPEGIRTEYKFSGTRPTEVRKIAKAGSGLADIVQTATYPDCVALINCNKPLTITDARGNTTTYTYDAAHGGVLTEVGPAVGGVSPAKKYSYTQRYAWVKNSSGTYVQAAAPVWLPTEVRSCNTSALNLATGACAAGTSDLVVTSYEYGPDSGPNNLWLRGTVVTAGGTSLRTCYGHDAQGNKISETSPRASLTVCP